MQVRLRLAIGRKGVAPTVAGAADSTGAGLARSGDHARRAATARHPAMGAVSAAGASAAASAAMSRSGGMEISGGMPLASSSAFPLAGSTAQIPKRWQGAKHGPRNFDISAITDYLLE